MRNLDSIFPRDGGGIKREILFEDGEWVMYRRPTDGEDRVFIVHRCERARFAVHAEDAGVRYRSSGVYKKLWVCGSGVSEDMGCGEKTPERMIGLWRLQGWDR